MNNYQINKIKDLISENEYVGRGIVIGKTKTTNKACIAYFIMGRSENSRNRIFELDNNFVYTKPFDEEKAGDPTLIIYNAIGNYKNHLVVTNGNQTTTILDGLKNGESFIKSCRKRCFEEDGPNFTPRISGILNFENNDFTYSMSILKSLDADGTKNQRFFFEYDSIEGLGHFIHTYQGNGNPLPSFYGEPDRVEIPDDIDEFSNTIWNNLYENNKISLYVRYIDLENLTEEERLFNKNK